MVKSFRSGPLHPIKQPSTSTPTRQGSSQNGETEPLIVSNPPAAQPESDSPVSNFPTSELRKTLKERETSKEKKREAFPQPEPESEQPHHKALSTVLGDSFRKLNQLDDDSGGKPQHHRLVYNDAEEYKEIHVKISVGCANLIKLDTFSDSDPRVCLFICLPGESTFQFHSMTETIMDNHFPNFEHQFEVNVPVQSKLSFRVYDDDDSEEKEAKQMGSICLTLRELLLDHSKPVQLRNPFNPKRDTRLVKKNSVLTPTVRLTRLISVLPYIEPHTVDLWEFVQEKAAKFADRRAYTVDGQDILYGHFIPRATKFALVLQEKFKMFHQDVTEQPCFAFLMPNCYLYLEAFAAAAATRSVMCALNHRLALAELQAVLEDGNFCILFASSQLSDLLQGINFSRTKIKAVVWSHCDTTAEERESLQHVQSLPNSQLADELAEAEELLAEGQDIDSDLFNPGETYEQGVQSFYTSGTTGRPKCVIHSHANVFFHTRNTVVGLSIKEETPHTWGHFGPMFHVGTVAFVWVGFQIGARHVFHPNQFHFVEVAKCMSQEKVTIVKLVPALVNYLLLSEEVRKMDFPALQWILTGGAKPSPAMIKDVEEVLGCDFIQGYGMTEATCHCAFKNESNGDPDAGLTPLPQLTIKIKRDDLSDCEVGEVGEVCIKGPNVIKSYFNNPQANADAFDSLGFYHSGDLGSFDENNTLTIRGRKKDMIIVGGENVMAVEVEFVVKKIPGVHSCAAFGLPDPMLGETVNIAIVRDTAYEGEEVNKMQVSKKCNELLAPYKCPANVFFLDTLPCTPTGKVQKDLVKAIVEDMPKSGLTGDLSSVESIVQNVLSDAFEGEDVVPDVTWFEAGLSSLHLVNLMSTLQQFFVEDLPPLLIYEAETPAQLIEALRGKEIKKADGQTDVAIELGPDDGEWEGLDEDHAASVGCLGKCGGQNSPQAVLVQLLLLLVRPFVFAVAVLAAVKMTNVLSVELELSGPVLVLLSPLSVWAALFALMLTTVVVKWVLVGKVKAGRYPLFSWFYFRWLCVHNLLRSLEPFVGMFRDTFVIRVYFNMLGAKIDLGVSLTTGQISDPDLVTVQKHAVVGRSVNLQPSYVSRGYLYLDPIVIGQQCVLQHGCTVQGGSTIANRVLVLPMQHVSRATAPQLVPGDHAPLAHKLHRQRQILFGWYWPLGKIVALWLCHSVLALSISIGVEVLRAKLSSEGINVDVAAVNDLLFVVEAYKPDALHVNRSFSDRFIEMIPFYLFLPVAIFIVAPTSYFIALVVIKKVVIGDVGHHSCPIDSTLAHQIRRWFWERLLDSPTLDMLLRQTTMSHITKWQYQLMGVTIGKNVYLTHPYVRDPELLVMGDNVVLAGNSAVLTSDDNTMFRKGVLLDSRSITANSCVHMGGTIMEKDSLLGDLSATREDCRMPANSTWVGFKSRFIGKRAGGDESDASLSGMVTYCFWQLVLFALDIGLGVGSIVPGYLVMECIAVSFEQNIMIPQYLDVLAGKAQERTVALWAVLPFCVFCIMFSKVLMVVLLKWVTSCRWKAGQTKMHRGKFVVWVFLEALLFDCEAIVLSQLQGTTFMNWFYVLMGAKIGKRCCLMGSVVGCEYDLKELGDDVCTNYGSSLFGHSVEKTGYLILRKTTIASGTTLGPRAIAEAGSECEGVYAGHTAVHNAGGDDHSDRPRFHHPTKEQLAMKVAMNALKFIGGGQRSKRRTTDLDGDGEVTSPKALGTRFASGASATTGSSSTGGAEGFRSSSNAGGSSAAADRSSVSSAVVPVATVAVQEEVMTFDKCLNLDDFRKLAKQSLGKTTFDYFNGGSSDELTVRMNRTSFDKYLIIPRFMKDVSVIDTTTDILGTKIKFPIIFAPSAMHGLAHPEGEVATAKAASRMNTIMCLSTLANKPMEEVANAFYENNKTTGCLFMQLYVFKRRDITEQIVRLAESLGFKALVLTIDAPITARREQDLRNGFTVNDNAVISNISMLGSNTVSQLVEFEKQHDHTLTWEIIEWLKSVCSLPVIVKGVMSCHDAEESIKYGAAAIIVSNHGGRQLDSVPATIDVVREIVEQVAGRVPVLMDGGIQRGSDVFKALAMGVTAVLIGRPVVYSLCYGDRGVQKMLHILQTELETTMKLAGITSIAELQQSNCIRINE